MISENEKEQLKKLFNHDEDYNCTAHDEGQLCCLDKKEYQDKIIQKVEEAYRKGVEDGGADENNCWQRELLFLNKENK